MSDYPEHDKLSEIREESQAIGEFLMTSGYTLCTVRDEGNNGAPVYRWVDEPRCERGIAGKALGREPDHFDYANKDADRNPERDSWTSGYVAVTGSVELILAKHFGIDLDALDREKRAMLADLRAKATA